MCLSEREEKHIIAGRVSFAKTMHTRLHPFRLNFEQTKTHTVLNNIKLLLQSEMREKCGPVPAINLICQGAYTLQKGQQAAGKIKTF
jgi:hypothetical protein